jgi:uncharacterized coiled-coil protein SlyX
MIHGRWLVLAFTLLATPGIAEEPTLSPLDKKVYDTLRELHNQGADIYNRNEFEGAYRYFQATLRFARAMLDHRPALQKFLDDELALCEKQTDLAKRTFAMHLLIEKLRLQIRPEAASKTTKPAPPPPKNFPEPLTTPPRELGPEKIDEPTLPPPPKKRIDPLLSLSKGIGGRVLFQGKYLPGISIIFVSRDQERLLTFETTSDPDGYYRLESIAPGKYTVLLTPTPNSPVRTLPERYSLLNTSSFILETKGAGEVTDVVLQ